MPYEHRQNNQHGIPSIIVSQHQHESCSEPPVLEVSTEPASVVHQPKCGTEPTLVHITKNTICRQEQHEHRKSGADLHDMAHLQICIFASFIGVGIFCVLTGLVLTCVGHSTTPNSALEIVVIQGHRAGGPILMGIGAAFLAYGIILCVYSKRPPLPRRPPPPNRGQRPSRTSITGMGSCTVVKGPQPEPTRFRRKGSITLSEPETTGLPEPQMNVTMDLDNPDK